MGIFTGKTYTDLDWADLRANALAQKTRRYKNPKEWDQRARAFANRNKSTTYIDLLLSHIPLEPSMTVLDIGSGSGTLAIPVARRIKKVTAIDFSQRMLDILEELANKEKIDNIVTVPCAWEDDWHKKGLRPHDIAIASRSIGVQNLEAALRKIDRYGTRYIFISDKIGATPFETEAFKAIGRPFIAGPDYIYTINTLYTLGIYPNITVLRPERDVTYHSIEEAIRSYSWMFHDITAKEILALEKYITTNIISSDGKVITVRRNTPPQWALIWWKKE